MESSKRKPFSDITNKYNLVPTSELRKLVAATSASNLLSKPPLSISNSNSTSTNRKFCSQSSNRSNTSIGSTNTSATLNSNTLQFRGPHPAITSSGGIGSKDAAYNQRHLIEKSKKEKEADVIVSRRPIIKRKGKGKAISENMKDNLNAIFNPSTLVERQNRKDVANLSLSCTSGEMVKGSKKGILNSYSCSFGKAFLDSSACALGKQIEVGKDIANKTCHSPEKRKNGKEGILKHSRSSIVKTDKIGQDKGKPLVTFNSLHEKAKKKGTAILSSSEIVEIADHAEKGSSASVAIKSRPPRRKCEKRKFDVGASSCPPMMSTKSMKDDTDAAGDIKSSKSWTDPHLKCRKKRCSSNNNTSILPLDFIEQQKAYFKEVDEFELPEEEVTVDELD